MTSCKPNSFPSLTGKSPPSDLECALFVLPARMGGLGIAIPSQQADRQHLSSLMVTSALQDHIILQNEAYGHEVIGKQLESKAIVEIEHATFSPLVLSATCGLAREATKDSPQCLPPSGTTPTAVLYAAWLHFRLAFPLLRSSIQAIRGARSSCGQWTCHQNVHSGRPKSTLNLAFSRTELELLYWFHLSFALCS